MNVISRRKLREFLKAEHERRQHADAFENWFKLARHARWRSFQDARALFGQTDVAVDTKSKRTATIFDIGGNKYRIITLIDYRRQTVLITHVMDHKEYDKNSWRTTSERGNLMAVATPRNLRRGADTYIKLIQQFPLKTLKNDVEHEQAVKMIEKLMGHDLVRGAGDYLDALILIVNAYEDEYHTPDGTDLTPQEALRAIMKANSMTQAEIGRIIGSESAVSMFLKGQRALSRKQIKALMARFRVDAALFL